MNLFAQSSAVINLDKKLSVKIAQETQYPWDGQVKITLNPEKAGTFALRLRIPGWAQNQPVPGDLYSYSTSEKDLVLVMVNGAIFQYKSEKGYAVIDREWNQGDVVNCSLPMRVRRVEANTKVADDLGKTALERGPIVYCLEGIDNPAIDQISISSNTALTSSFNGELLSGITIISGSDKTDNVKFTAIPYYVWNNRGADKMKVWIPKK